MTKTPKASRGRKTGTVYRTPQSTSGSEGAPSAPPVGWGKIGAPGPPTILLLSKTENYLGQGTR